MPAGLSSPQTQIGNSQLVYINIVSCIVGLPLPVLMLVGIYGEYLNLPPMDPSLGLVMGMFVGLFVLPVAGFAIITTFILGSITSIAAIRNWRNLTSDRRATAVAIGAFMVFYLIAGAVIQTNIVLAVQEEIARDTAEAKSHFVEYETFRQALFACEIEKVGNLSFSWRDNSGEYIRGWKHNNDPSKWPIHAVSGNPEYALDIPFSHADQVTQDVAEANKYCTPPTEINLDRKSQDLL